MSALYGSVSDLTMFVQELLDVFHVHSVVDIWVPLEGRFQKPCLSWGSLHDSLLVPHVIVRQSWELSSLP